MAFCSNCGRRGVSHRQRSVHSVFGTSGDLWTIHNGFWTTPAPSKSHKSQKTSWAGFSSVTLTVTSIPRNELEEPSKVPHKGKTRSGDQAPATRIRFRFPTTLLVGSKSIQPAPGKYVCIHAWVAPPPVTLVSWPGTKIYPLTKRAANPNERVASIIRTAKSRQLPERL